MPDELRGQRGARAHRVEVAAAQVLARVVVHRVREGGAVPELALVPDQVDVVVVLGHRSGGPATAAGLPDELEAGVDPGDVVAYVVAADRVRADVPVGELARCGVAVGKVDALDQAPVVHLVLRVG
jgi:hypothetical protein